MIDTVIFDIDGTLIDSEQAFYASLWDTIRFFRLDIRREETENLFGASVGQVTERLRLSNPGEFGAKWEDRFNHMCGPLELFPGVLQLLEALAGRGVRMLLLTSRNRATVDYMCTHSPIRGYIQGCITAEDTDRHKPDPAPMNEALRRFRLSPRQTIYVGDTDADLRCARGAGVRFALAGWNPKAAASPCDCRLERPGDLLALL